MYKVDELIYDGFKGMKINGMKKDMRSFSYLLFFVLFSFSFSFFFFLLIITKGTTHLEVAMDNLGIVQKSNSGAMHHGNVALATELQHFCPQVGTPIIIPPAALVIPYPTAPHTAPFD